MAFTDAALAKIKHLRTSSPSTPEIIPKIPPYPDEIKKRFPEATAKHEADWESWRVKANLAITGGSGTP